MMNTNTKREVKHGFEAMTEYTLYANTGELEETQDYDALKVKAERILANAERKGIKADIESMLDDLYSITGVKEWTEELNAIGAIVYEYQKPTEKQVAFA